MHDIAGEVSLKPCPFCGGEAVMKCIGNEHTRRAVEIKCSKCRVMIKHGAIRYSMEWLTNIAIEAWNRRIPALRAKFPAQNPVSLKDRIHDALTIGPEEMFASKPPAQGKTFTLPPSDPAANKAFERDLTKYLSTHPKALTDEINAYASGWIAARDFYRPAPSLATLPRRCEVCGREFEGKTWKFWPTWHYNNDFDFHICHGALVPFDRRKG